MTVAEWAERYRFLSADTSALPGRYSLAITPYLRGILEAITDRHVRKVVCQKSAQVGWTDGVINNFVGYTIHIAPAPVGIMFPRDQNAKDYNVEKFGPMVEATPVLAEIVATKTRTLDNTQNRKKFPGGFLKFVGSNSTGGVKSTPLKIAIIEEPDDCNLNIKGQGDSIKLFEERLKTFHDSKLLAGGTPSIKGISSIEAEMAVSDQRYFMVPCHDCGESHALSWENVHYLHDETRSHPVYGTAIPESTHYICPHCGSVWNDAAKNRNVRRGEWTASAEFRGIAGFYINELYSPFPESKLGRLVEKYLLAEHEAEQGETGALIAFWNSTLGLPYEFQSDAPSEQALSERAEDYFELTVPWGGLVLTVGVDVQHDRVAIVVRAWGRGEESWLVYWGEIFGSTLVPLEGVWKDLDAFLDREFPHASGKMLQIKAESIDSSDGAVTDAVYAFVRHRRRRGKLCMAIKGASEATDDKREIFNQPKPSVDLNRKNKASKHGLQPFIVGTTRAKDLIDTRMKLHGTGPGRMHWYASVRSDYWGQLVSEVKAPHRTVRHKRVWQKKAGVRNEALDGEVYALHAARSLKLNLYRDSHWAGLENALRQLDILPKTDPPPASLFPPAGEVSSITAPHPAAEDAGPADEAAASSPKSPAPIHRPSRPRPPKGFSVTTW